MYGRAIETETGQGIRHVKREQAHGSKQEYSIANFRSNLIGLLYCDYTLSRSTNCNANNMLSF